MKRHWTLCNFGIEASEINKICPTITPTIGPDELIINGGFDDGSAWSVGANWSIGSGVATRVAGATTNLSQNVLTAHNWYQVIFDIPTYTAGVFFALFGDNSQVVPNRFPQGTAYTQTMRAVGAVAGIRVSAASAGAIDNVSYKLINFASMTVLLGTRSQQNGSYQCAPTLASGTQCGMLLCYKDATNFLVLIVTRGQAVQAQILKCSGGAYSSVVAGAITYGAGQALKAIVNGTDVSLHYNGVQIGVTTAVADIASFGNGVYGFNTLAGNEVGLVQTNFP